MRVALVDQAAKMGGVEVSTLYLAQRIDRAAYEPIVLCTEEGDLPRLCRQSGIKTTVVPLGRTFSTSLRVAGRRIANPLAVLADGAVILIGALHLARALRRESVDLVCTKGLLAHFYGGIAARLVGVPCVWHVQDWISGRAAGLFRWVLGAGARLLAAQVIADGPSIVEQMPAALRSSGRVSLVCNGVDVSEFSSDVSGATVRAELGLRPDWLVVGNVARLTPWKGQHLLLQAAAEIADEFPQAHFLIVGSPLFDTAAYERRLLATADAPKLRGRVTFAGYRHDLPEVLAAVDVFAYTATEKDTSPLSLLSAMASGRPVVAPSLTGIAELIGEGESGLLYPTGDAAALASALRRVLADAGLREKLGRGARTRAEREFTVEQYARRCAAVFDRALGVSAPLTERARIGSLEA